MASRQPKVKCPGAATCDHEFHDLRAKGKARREEFRKETGFNPVRSALNWAADQGQKRYPHGPLIEDVLMDRAKRIQAKKENKKKVKAAKKAEKKKKPNK